MKLSEMTNTPGARKKRTRVGRGDGSGHGQTCGRGHKGQHSRTGARSRPYFEGGQTTFFRRLPKKGFNSPGHVTYTVLNVGALEKAFEPNASVDEAVLIGKGLIPKVKQALKILGDGEISKPLTVTADAFSASARAKIEKAGGSCVLARPRPAADSAAPSSASKAKGGAPGGKKANE